MIEINNLTKKYGNFVAVDGISLSVGAGEIFGFLGVNGAGKTTTIRMMAGILQPSEGSISLGGYDVQADREKARAITGYIPDRPYMYNKLTGREFLYFMCDLYRVPKDVMEERIDLVLEEYGLTQWQDELIESYSHGMKQRLATGAALVHDPQILIIDEPMVGLDPHGAKLLKDAMRKYAASGKSVFLSTHSLNVAEEVADRLAIIQSGRILTIGTYAEIQQQTGTLSDKLEHLFLQLTATEHSAPVKDSLETSA